MLRQQVPPPEDGDPFSDDYATTPRTPAPGGQGRPREGREGPQATIPPSDLQAEQACLGAMLLGDQDAVQRGLAVVEARHFYRDVHKRLCAVIAAIHERGEPVDEVTVSSELRGAGDLEDCGGVPYLVHLGEICPTSANVARYAEIVRDLATARELMGVGAEITAMGEQYRRHTVGSNGRSAADVVLEARGRLEAITVSRKGVPIMFGDALAEVIGDPQWLWPGWLPKGLLTVLAGDPGMGKSALALWIAANLGCGGKWPDGSIMAEATKTLWADGEGMQGENLKRLRVWGYDQAHVGWIGEDGMPFVDLRPPGAFRSIAESAAGAGCGLVVVDSLSTSCGGNEDSDVLEPILTEANLAARDLELGVLVIHHLRKQREAEPARVALDRLRGSSVIGQVARSVWGMWRPDRQNPAVRIEVIKANLARTGVAFGMEWGEKALTFGEAPESPEESPPTVRGAAEEFVRVVLGRGPMTGGELEKAAEDQKLTVSRRTLYNAIEKLGCRQVLVARGTRQVKCWALPHEGVDSR